MTVRIPRSALFSLALAAALGLGLLLGARLAPVADAQTLKKLPAATGKTAPGAYTVWLGTGKASGRKDDAARAMNDLHAEMAKLGYQFSGALPYLENNDLQGWWITYVAVP